MAYWQKTQQNTTFWQNHEFPAFDENHGFRDFLLSLNIWKYMENEIYGKYIEIYGKR